MQVDDGFVVNEVRNHYYLINLFINGVDFYVFDALVADIKVGTKSTQNGK